MTYYDYVKVNSGTGKKITVNGEENVGMAIGNHCQQRQENQQQELKILILLQIYLKI